MMLRYIGVSSDKLVQNKKYIVYAYEVHENGSEHYWVLDEEVIFTIISNDIEIVDNKHSKYWKTATVGKNRFYYPSPWIDNVPSDYYDEKSKEIYRIWEWRYDISSYEGYFLFKNKYCYWGRSGKIEQEKLNQITSEYPNFFNECNQNNLKYKAEVIEDNWVFCPIKTCKESFSVLEQNCIVTCPKCLTEMYNPLYIETEKIKQVVENYSYIKSSKNKINTESIESINKYSSYDEIYADLSKLFKRYISSEENLETLLKKISKENGGISIRNIRYSLDKFKDKNISYTKEELDTLNDLKYLLGG